VVSAPSVGAGTTHEVHLRNKKIPRDVVSAPSVGAGTTYEVCIRQKLNLVMWFQHRQSVLVPLTRSAYDQKNLVMWSQHRQSVLIPLRWYAYVTQKNCIHPQFALYYIKISYIHKYNHCLLSQNKYFAMWYNECLLAENVVDKRGSSTKCLFATISKEKGDCGFLW
jgi:hypothetical protein